MPKIVAPPLAVPRNASPELAEFQRSVLSAFQGLTTQLNAAAFTSEPAPATLDMGHQRVSNVAQPSAEGDAVNLGFLRRSFKAGAGGGVRSASAPGFYQIIFDGQGDISTGTLVAPAYPTGINRGGTPVEANISALVPPVGTSIAVNFLVLSGTNTSTLLASDLVLPAGTATMVTATNFQVPALQYLDRVVLKVNRVGSSTPGSLVSIGIVVKAGG